MKVAYFDTICGIAGDMTLAAFVSAGMPFDTLTAELHKLSIGGFRLEQSRVLRSAIDAVHIDVVITEEPHYHRHLKDILGIIEASTLAAGVKARAAAIFRVIAEAEAKVHGSTIEKIHFHEVGALDSIVDIVGTAICLESLGIDTVYSSPVKLGAGGIITTQHGAMPTPAPATIEILKDYPVVFTSLPHELTTPTGAAIIRALSQGVLGDGVLRIHSVGYGAGTKEFEGIPNLLRIIIGERDPLLEQDEVISIDTTIDDLNPQLYPYIIERLLSVGALDAYLTPIIMKKGRPGLMLSVLSTRSTLEAVTGCIFRETSTIGLRINDIGRIKLPRRLLEVQTSFGTIKAKAITRDGTETVVPEFEECRRIALERKMPVSEVMRKIRRELEP
jgi:uncharacterized protein (TIGR00299 family) protein